MFGFAIRKSGCAIKKPRVNTPRLAISRNVDWGRPLPVVFFSRLVSLCGVAEHICNNIKRLLTEGRFLCVANFD
jgi:hypothetical protein